MALYEEFTYIPIATRLKDVRIHARNVRSRARWSRATDPLFSSSYINCMVAELEVDRAIGARADLQRVAPDDDMTLPQYVQSIVKYKSPHPQDLSFQKGAYIRVLGLAERTGDDEDDEDEEDHWYLGELLDGTKRGQFPASLVKPVDAQDIAGLEPSASSAEASVPSAAPAAAVAVPAKAETEEVPKETTAPVPTAPEMKPEQVQHAGAAKEEAKVPLEAAPIASEFDAARMEPVPMATETAPSGVLMVRTETLELDAEPFTSESHPAPPEPTVPVAAAPKPTTPVQEQKPPTPTSSEPRAPTSSEPRAPTSSEPHAPTSSEPRAPASSEAEVPDPSRLSLRERIAAFNKPIDKAPPPPIPRGKPGGWKRPPPPENGQKPPMPAPTEARAASGQAPAPAPVGEPVRNDAPGSFSASDAKSSIKMSLKERMAALQRNEAEVKPPVALPPRKLSRDVESEAAPEEEADEDEKARRAAITQRMARIGGQKMGPFGGVAPPTQPPAKAVAPEAAAAPTQADGTAPDAEPTGTTETAAQVPMPNAETDGADAPETLVIPRRAAAPRTRRPKPAASAPAPVDAEAPAPDTAATTDATSPDISPAVPVIRGSDEATKPVGADGEPEKASSDAVPATGEAISTEPQAPMPSVQSPPVPSVPHAVPEQGAPRESTSAATEPPVAPSPTATQLADEFALPSAQSETTRPELLTDMRAHREPYAHTAPVEEQPQSVPSSPVNVKTPVLETVPTRPAPVPNALESNRSVAPETQPAAQVVPPVSEQSDAAPSIQAERATAAMPSHPAPMAPVQEGSAIVPDAVPIKSAVPPPRSAPPPPIVPAAPVAEATQKAPGQDAPPAAMPRQAAAESDDFIEQRQQLEQLLGEEQNASGQESSALPYMRGEKPGATLQDTSTLPLIPGEAPASEPQEAAQPTVTRITRVPATPTEEAASPPTAHPERVAPVPPLVLDSKTETLSPPQGASLGRTNSTASEKDMRSAPLFAPSPSDVSFPTFASPPQHESEEPQPTEEDAEQVRRAQLAQRMARIGGQRIAGIPGMPIAARPAAPMSQTPSEPVPAPQTPSVQPDAPVVPQQPTLPNVPVVGTPDTETAPAAHPQRPVRRAPTLPPDAQMPHDGVQEHVEAHALPTRAPPSRPPPSRAPPSAGEAPVRHETL